MLHGVQDLIVARAAQGSARPMEANVRTTYAETPSEVEQKGYIRVGRVTDFDFYSPEALKRDVVSGATKHFGLTPDQMIANFDLVILVEAASVGFDASFWAKSKPSKPEPMTKKEAVTVFLVNHVCALALWLAQKRPRGVKCPGSSSLEVVAARELLNSDLYDYLCKPDKAQKNGFVEVPGARFDVDTLDRAPRDHIAVLVYRSLREHILPDEPAGRALLLGWWKDYEAGVIRHSDRHSGYLVYRKR